MAPGCGYLKRVLGRREALAKVFKPKDPKETHSLEG
jgi:hypothetical protein